MNGRKVAAWLALVLPSMASAQGRLSFGEIPAVGSYADYRVIVTKNGDSSRGGSSRIACLSQETIGGTSYLWCEVSRLKGKKRRTFRILLPRSEVNRSDEPLSIARKVIYQESGKAAMLAEGATLGSLVTLLQSIQGEASLRHASSGRAVLTLPDGKEVKTFRKQAEADVTLPNGARTHVESEVFASRSIPFGVVKRIVKTKKGDKAEKTELYELVRTGPSGAKSYITGQVKPFNLLELLLGGK